MRSVGRLAVAAVLAVAFGTLAVTEGALHPPRRDLPLTAAADRLARNTGSDWDEASVTAGDGVVLKAWRFTSLRPNGGAVILLHGVADTRMGMMAHAEFLLQHGYTVLLPDLRGSGASGGMVTYGLREARDVHTWADWLLRDPSLKRLYGIGQSLGGAVLIQSLATEPRFRAIVADCPYATFKEIAYDRLHQIGRLPEPLFWPIIEEGFLYTDVRYGLDLTRASPLAAIRATHTPVLLIHGLLDTNIPPRHSQELAAANPRATQLWLVPGAGHVQSLSVEGAQYVRRVVSWFEEHR